MMILCSVWDFNFSFLSLYSLFFYTNDNRDTLLLLGKVFFSKFFFICSCILMIMVMFFLKDINFFSKLL